MECFSDLPCSKIDICSLNKFEKLVTDSRRLVRVSGRLRPSSLNSPIQVPSAERCATLPITFQKSSEKNKSNYPYIRLSREFISNQSADDSYSYSIDDLDMNWLNLYNREFSTSFTPNLMCNIINELEDGLHDYLFANGVSNLFEAQPIENANVYSETICQICYGIESESGNAIVICDGCNVAVHQSCYGIEERLPDGPWLCRPCQYGQSKPLCYLCANDLNGPFTSVRNREVVWAHSVCAHWIPEIIFGCMETCSNIRLMPGASKRKIYKCVVCGVSKAGFCISCSVEGCTKWFHPSCGFASNYGMVCFSNNSGEIIRKSFCSEHLSNVGLYADTKNLLTFYPPNIKNTGTSYKETFYNWTKQIVKIQIMIKKYNIEQIHLNNFISYWHKKRHLHNYYALKPSKIIDKCKQIAKIASDIYNKKQELMYLRCELEKLRNLTYLILKREKIKQQKFQLKNAECKDTENQTNHPKQLSHTTKINTVELESSEYKNISKLEKQKLNNIPLKKTKLLSHSRSLSAIPFGTKLYKSPMLSSFHHLKTLTRSSQKKTFRKQNRIFFDMVLGKRPNRCLNEYSQSFDKLKMIRVNKML